MIYHLYANQSNAGDWLSAKGVQALLAPRRVHELFCDEPYLPATFAVLDQAGPDDFIILGGGGLFMDYFSPFWERFRAAAARVPFVIWGAGACELKLERSRLAGGLMTEIVRQSRLCVVRDEMTRELLAECNLPPAVICPAVVAIPTTAGAANVLLHVDHYSNVGAENYERMVAMGGEFARATGREYRSANNLIRRGDAAQLQRLLGHYAAADVILSSRLHGCIIALAMGRRVLVVSGDHKIEAFMRAAGLSEWVLDLNQLGELPERLERLPRQPAPTAFIEEGRRQNRAVASEVIAMLAGCESSVVA